MVFRNFLMLRSDSRKILLQSKNLWQEEVVNQAKEQKTVSRTLFECTEITFIEMIVRYYLENQEILVVSKVISLFRH